MALLWLQILLGWSGGQSLWPVTPKDVCVSHTVVTCSQTPLSLSSFSCFFFPRVTYATRSTFFCGCEPSQTPHWGSVMADITSVSQWHLSGFFFFFFCSLLYVFLFVYWLCNGHIQLSYFSPTVSSVLICFGSSRHTCSLLYVFLFVYWLCNGHIQLSYFSPTVSSVLICFGSSRHTCWFCSQSLEGCGSTWLCWRTQACVKRFGWGQRDGQTQRREWGDGGW